MNPFFSYIGLFLSIHRQTLQGTLITTVIQVLFQRIFPRATSQVTISQMCNFPCGNLPKVRLGPLRPHMLQQGLSAAARMGAERCDQNMLEAKSSGQDRLGRLPHGKLHILEVATWEIASQEKWFGKVPNIKISWTLRELTL